MRRRQWGEGDAFEGLKQIDVHGAKYWKMC
jgi:hypothetical protein